jgi:hypothetical protein
VFTLQLKLSGYGFEMCLGFVPYGILTSGQKPIGSYFQLRLKNDLSFGILASGHKPFDPYFQLR